MRLQVTGENSLKMREVRKNSLSYEKLETFVLQLTAWWLVKAEFLVLWN